MHRLLVFGPLATLFTFHPKVSAIHCFENLPAILFWIRFLLRSPDTAHSPVWLGSHRDIRFAPRIHFSDSQFSVSSLCFGSQFDLEPLVHIVHTVRIVNLFIQFPQIESALEKLQFSLSVRKPLQALLAIFRQFFFFFFCG